MDVVVDGVKAHYANGSRPIRRKEPAVILIHGAGMDRTVWQLQTRNIAYMGYQVLAVDLPGHGRSEGKVLPSIGEMADWIMRLMIELKLKSAALIGHSMGALIALEVGSRYPKNVEKLCLMGVASRMPVHPELLKAAKKNQPLASDLIMYWGLGDKAQIGGHPHPGLWVHGANEILIRNSQSGVLYNDLAACDSYQGAVQAAEKVQCSSLFILGDGDKMTPLKQAKKLTEVMQSPEVRVIKDCGHMMMSERPNEVSKNLKAFI